MVLITKDYQLTLLDEREQIIKTVYGDRFDKMTREEQDVIRKETSKTLGLGEDEIETSSYAKFIFELLNVHSIVFLSGGPGSGKSSTVRKLIHKYHAQYVRTAAPTHIAAENVKGSTIFSLFRLNPGITDDYKKMCIEHKTKNKTPLTVTEFAQRYLNQQPVQTADYYASLKTLKLIIVDEISMINEVCFAYILVLQKEQKFKLLLVGDFFQLPPVNDDYLFTKDIWTKIITKENSVYLVDNLRNPNPKFNNFLKTIRENSFDMPFFEYFAEKMEEPRWLSNVYRNEVHSLTSNIYTYLVGTNKKRRAINDKIIDYAWHRNECRDEYFSNVITYFHTFKMHIYDDFKNKILDKQSKYKDTSEQLKDKTDEEMEELFSKRKYDYNLRLFTGCKVIFTENSDQFKNGTRGTFNGVDNGLLNITIHDPHYGDRNISVAKNTIKNDRGEPCYTQYPILLAYALTVHKSQGMSIENVCVLIDTFFEVGQFYVAVSRCSDESHLYIKHNYSTPLITTSIDALMKCPFMQKYRKADVSLENINEPYVHWRLQYIIRKMKEERKQVSEIEKKFREYKKDYITTNYEIISSKNNVIEYYRSIS